MATTAAARGRFVDGQLLSAADLSAEQEAQIARLRRHAIGAHTWGIVHGGEPTVGDDGVVTVAPVFAYDGYGRELALPAPRAVPAAERFELLDTDVLDCWLVYRRDAVDAPLTDAGCADADRGGRWSEMPLVRLTAAAGGPAASRQPPGVPAGDIPFPPARMPPDDPTNEWPVFLGQIHRSPGAAPGAFQYRADITGRPYVGARAATIEPPWGGAGTRLELDPSPGNALELSVASAATDPVLTVSAAGDVELDGEATIGGWLHVGGGRVTLDPGSPPPGSAWRISHVAAPGQAGELRIETGAAGGRVVVGSWSAVKNAFVAHLTVADSGAVTVAGDLRVEGDLEVQGDIAADLQTARRAYLDALNALALAGTDATKRTAILTADAALGTALSWPAP
jgi:hypothetical protein